MHTVTALILSLLVFGLSVFWLWSLKKQEYGGWIDADRCSRPWKEQLPDIASNHTQVAGVLAGFSITIVVLIATFQPESNASLRQDSLGVFMVSFFGYVATGILFSLVTERFGIHRFFLFSVAASLYYISVLISFSGISLLLTLMRFSSLMLPVALFTGLSIVGGYMAVCIPLYDLLRLRRRLCLLLFLCAASLAGIFLSMGLLFTGRGQLLLEKGLLTTSVLIVLVFAYSMLTFYVEWPEREDERKERVLINSLSAILALSTAAVIFIYVVTLCVAVPSS